MTEATHRAEQQRRDHDRSYRNRSTDREQFRVERTIDRTNTTGAVWLGLTVGCAQCHDHKYDPFSQKDYYRLLAFFNTCDEPTFPIGGRDDLEEKIEKLQKMEFWIQKNGGSREDIEARRALASLMRLGWGLNNPAFCRTFTCRFIPEATPQHEQWFDELQRVSTSPENAARLMERDDGLDVRALLAQVRTPTLVIHCNRDQAVLPERGRQLAAEIAGARYVSLPGANHLMMEDEPAWPRFLAELGLFLDW